jgi:diguanylate cyclase (GGDEF)-like protein
MPAMIRCARAAIPVLLLLALGAIAPLPARAEDGLETAVFSSLGPREGLSNASVSGIVQDRAGFLWLGTQGGLFRYDGHSFKLYENEPFNLNSLCHNQVQTLYLDGDALWIGTYGGLNRLDLKTEAFTRYSNDPVRPDSLPNDLVIAVARDSRGSLWVGTKEGLGRLDEATGRFERFLHSDVDPRSLPANTVRALKADREGRLWVGTSGGGLARFDYAAGGFETYRHEKGKADSLLSDFVMSIDEDAEGALWIGSWYGGLSRFDQRTGRFTNRTLADDRVYVVSAAEPGFVYAGTWGGGLFELNIATGVVKRYRAGGPPGSLSHDIVYSILRDSSGELWFGTNGGGIDKLGRNRQSVRVYHADAADPAALPPGKVFAAAVDGRGRLWAGAYNGGLARLEGTGGPWRRYRHDPARPRSLPNDIVNFVRVDSSGRVWAGTNDGLALYDPARDDFDVLKPVPGRPDLLSSEIIFAMADAPGGDAWIGTFRSGLEYWDRSAGTFIHYAHADADPDSLSDDLVNALAYDGQGRLWAGTNKGLDRFEGGRFVRYYYDPQKPSGISSDSIKTLFLDSKAVLWIGSLGGGLMRYEPETDSFVSYTKKDGLPSNSVQAILEDRSGKLWVATQGGIVVYDRNAGVFRGLSLYNEFRDREFFQGACAGPDGSLYFGALDAIYRFDPGRYEFNTHRPAVAITDISVFHKSRFFGLSASRLPRLDLSWRETTVEFQFAALDFRDPERNRYAYRLDGFDPGWIACGSGHSASYTNLPGGSYTFRVKASNNDGLWNEEGVALPLRIGFPPFLSPLAIAAYVIIAIGLGFFLATIHVRHARTGHGAALKVLEAELADTKARLTRLSAVDDLTGLANRGATSEALDRAFSAAVMERTNLALVVIDIDNFKSYNDRYGRQAGDDCLRRVAACLVASLERAHDAVGRWGGEEFVIVLPEAGLEGAREVAERARKAVFDLGIPHDEAKAAGFVTVSAGCAATLPEEGHSPAALMGAAVKALFAAKEKGRNQVSD